MGVFIPPGFAQVIHAFEDTVTGAQTSVTIGINPDESQLQAAVDAADDSFRAGWLPSQYDSNARLLPAVMYWRQNANDLFFFQSSLLAVPGTVTQSSPPPQVAIVIRKRTSAVGKNKRGRVYMPHWFAGENVISEQGTLTPAAVIALQGRSDAWLASLQSQSELGDGMWLFHSDPLAAPTIVTDLLVQPIVRTQRRRLPRA